MAKKKILVVDDEVSVAKLVKFVIEKTGSYEVDTENLGVNAISKIKLFKPDLVVLDLNLPDLSGGEISAAMKNDPDLEEIPVIFLTGNVTNEEAQQGLQISGRPALSKPINMEMLLACVRDSIK